MVQIAELFGSWSIWKKEQEQGGERWPKVVKVVGPTSLSMYLFWHIKMSNMQVENSQLLFPVLETNPEGQLIQFPDDPNPCNK